MTPIERAARALCELDGNPPGATMDGKPLWQDYLPEVHAVATAFREPSEEMIDAGCDADEHGLGRYNPPTIWLAMLDKMIAQG